MFVSQWWVAAVASGAMGVCLGATPAAVPFCPAQVQFSAASRADPPEGFDLKAPCSGESCVDPTRLIEVPKGWAATIKPQKLDLEGAGFSYGPPNELGQLKPEIDVRRGISHETTSFDTGTAPYRGYWLECDYGKGLVHLSRQLPDGLKQCTVTYSPAVGNGTPRVSMQCK